VADGRVENHLMESPKVLRQPSPFHDWQGNKNRETERRATIELLVEGAID